MQLLGTRMPLPSPCVFPLSSSTLVPIGASNRWERPCRSGEEAGDSSPQSHCVSKKHLVRRKRRAWRRHLSGHGPLWGRSGPVTSQRRPLNWPWNKNRVLQGQEAERCCFFHPLGELRPAHRARSGDRPSRGVCHDVFASINSSPITFLNYLEINVYKNYRFIDSHNKSPEVFFFLFFFFQF